MQHFLLTGDLREMYPGGCRKGICQNLPERLVHLPNRGQIRMKPEMRRSGTQDRGHYVDTLEVERTFRRRTSESASSLRVKEDPGNSKPSSGNHQPGWSRYRGSQDQNPSRTEAGLDASGNIHVATEARARFFSLTSPFTGQLNESVVPPFSLRPYSRSETPVLKLRY
jgi:hypothetical protein